MGLSSTLLHHDSKHPHHLSFFFFFFLSLPSAEKGYLPRKILLLGVGLISGIQLVFAGEGGQRMELSRMCTLE